MAIGRPPKPSKVLNCKIREDIWNALDEHCQQTGTNKTFIAEKAIQEYLERYNKQQEVLRKKNLL